MCSVLVAWRWRPDVPLVLAANRDERLARETDPPLLLHTDPAIWGGRDRVAGGTWLAIEPLTGSVAAVTNRHVGEADAVRDDSKRSRGELPVRLLTAGGYDGAEAVLRSLSSEYNPVNALYFGPGGALAGSVDPPASGGRSRWYPLTTGVHALTVGDLDDPTSAKTMRLREGARRAAAEATDAADLRDRFAALLTSHRTDGDEPASAPCIHGDEYGTVSSSTVVVSAEGVELRHAPGRPCVTPYVVVDMTVRN